MIGIGQFDDYFNRLLTIRQSSVSANVPNVFAIIADYWR
jgi:hypothetical protein